MEEERRGGEWKIHATSGKLPRYGGKREGYLEIVTSHREIRRRKALSLRQMIHSCFVEITARIILGLHQAAESQIARNIVLLFLYR